MPIIPYHTLWLKLLNGLTFCLYRLCSVCRSILYTMKTLLKTATKILYYKWTSWCSIIVINQMSMFVQTSSNQICPCFLSNCQLNKQFISLSEEFFCPTNEWCCIPYYPKLVCGSSGRVCHFFFQTCSRQKVHSSKKFCGRKVGFVVDRYLWLISYRVSW